jgi:hypothetical protein
VDDRDTADTPLTPLASLPPIQYPDFETVRQMTTASQKRELFFSTPMHAFGPPSPPPDDDQFVSPPKPTIFPHYTFNLDDSDVIPRRKHDEVVIEEDDMLYTAPEAPVSRHSPNHSQRVSIHEVTHLRTNGCEPHISNTSSWISGDDVPVLDMDNMAPSPYNSDVFPQSPFSTPLKERSRVEEEEEEIVYEKASNGSGNISANGIHWPTQRIYFHLIFKLDMLLILTLSPRFCLGTTSTRRAE